MKGWLELLPTPAIVGIVTLTTKQATATTVPWCTRLLVNVAIPILAKSGCLRTYGVLADEMRLIHSHTWTQKDLNEFLVILQKQENDILAYKPLQQFTTNRRNQI